MSVTWFAVDASSWPAASRWRRRARVRVPASSRRSGGRSAPRRRPARPRTTSWRPPLGGYYDDIAADCAATLDGADSPRCWRWDRAPAHGGAPSRPAAGRALDGLDIDRAMLDAASAGSRTRGTRAGHASWRATSPPCRSRMPRRPRRQLALAHHWPDAAVGFARSTGPASGATALVFDLPVSWAHAEPASKASAPRRGLRGTGARPLAGPGAVDADVARGGGRVEWSPLHEDRTLGIAARWPSCTRMAERGR